jgi:hypothetical protein
MTGLTVIQVFGWIVIIAVWCLMIRTALRMHRDLRRTPIPLATTLALLTAIERKMRDENWHPEQRLCIYAMLFGVEGPSLARQDRYIWEQALAGLRQAAAGLKSQGGAQ